MSESDPIQILLLHDRWASGQILDACAKLTDEQFHRRFEIGPGSLHDTLTHIIGTMRALSESLAGTPLTPRLEGDGQKRTPQQLRILLDEWFNEVAAQARRRPLDEPVSRRTRDGQLRTLPRSAWLVHLFTHGMHHRAQCLNMLRHLGVKPLPPSSVAEWGWNA
jgi:uncharacterized damage-inducible protein DinB